MPQPRRVVRLRLLEQRIHQVILARAVVVHAHNPMQVNDNVVRDEPHPVCGRNFFGEEVGDVLDAVQFVERSVIILFFVSFCWTGMENIYMPPSHPHPTLRTWRSPYDPPH